MVEVGGALARELEVLLLVGADGHVGGPVHEDVGGLEHGVREQAELQLAHGGVVEAGLLVVHLELAL